jgi:hypothetical protein
MGDLKSPRLLYLKGGFFLIIGMLASALILIENPGAKIAFLLVMSIWGFARAYYFAFYVVEHYVDDGYKFAGLWQFAQYVVRRKQTKAKSTQPAVGESRDAESDSA